MIITGNLITVHALSGLTLPIDQVSDGQTVNISGKTYVFVVEDCFEVQLTPRGTGLLLTVSETQIATIPLKGPGKKFALVDRTASPDAVLWSGTIRVEGFTNG
jgi:hypothetical protein